MEIKKREEISEDLKWNLRDLASGDEDLDNRLVALSDDVDAFVIAYKGNLETSERIADCLDAYMRILQERILLGSYANLNTSVDMGNTTSMRRMAKTSNILVGLDAKISFVETEIANQTEEILNRVIDQRADLKGYIDDVLRNKKYLLDPKTEEALSSLQNTFRTPYSVYNQAKLVDMDFGTFNVNGVDYPLSYNIFEGVMESEPSTDVRRAAFENFYSVLEKYKHTTAACYAAQVQQEKVLSRLRGYDSVFDYLLFDQKVDRELYDRQIDTIMKELAPHMRKYAKLLQKVHGLEKMTYADLKLNLDPGYEPAVDIDKAKEYVLDGLSVLGAEYREMLTRAFSERWIDFANNHGKSTGAFCSSPYGSHSYILISWTSLMAEVMVLAHELGHAGHFFMAHRNQNILDSRPSLYFIEAPSTANEIIMETYLLEKAENTRDRRWVLSQIIARTYYHNFVTHFMEAAYQREVYKILDAGGSVDADKLSEIFREKLIEFWGEDIEILPGSELTWMRQPHYYMGLYPYTYSAGLTIGTQVAKRILKEGEVAVNDWINTLKAGGTKTPKELALMAGVDISTDKPLKDTIAYIGEVIDELVKLTEEMDLSDK